MLQRLDVAAVISRYRRMSSSADVRSAMASLIQREGTTVQTSQLDNSMHQVCSESQ